jgi:hypothetical protein
MDTPSISNTPSIPNSPPPSFHTHSSPGTPRPTQSIRTGISGSTGTGIAGPYNELWGVAPSTLGGENATSNDALATIAGLKQRVEWLEESIGRLLLEKEERQSNDSKQEESKHGERNNCCVSFTDATPDLEQAMIKRNNNCCVRFKREDTKRDHKIKALATLGVIAFAVLMMVFLIKSVERSGGHYTVSNEGVKDVSGS